MEKGAPGGDRRSGAVGDSQVNKRAITTRGGRKLTRERLVSVLLALLQSSTNNSETNYFYLELNLIELCSSRGGSYTKHLDALVVHMPTSDDR